MSSAACPRRHTCFNADAVAFEVEEHLVGPIGGIAAGKMFEVRGTASGGPVLAAVQPPAG